ncbi:MAG: polysaccharide deacetylase family protein [Streptococcaceae bacterium]|nr:polysaccharide deacetylase family protein [Streptococcaceae bacterium]
MKKRIERRKKRNYWQIILLPLLILVIVIAIIIVMANIFGKKSKNASNNNKVLPTSQTTSKATNQSKQAKKWLISKSENQLPILMFHYVTSKPEELPQDSNNIDIATFEKELKTLKEQGYITASALQAQRILTIKEKPSNKLVWLTFDDGSITMYTKIFPLLKKYQIHATSFIITGFVNHEQGGILTWNQIKEMKTSGLVDFGSHTVDHFDLGQQNSEAQQMELIQSKADLDKNLNQNTNMICYPAGGYNQNTLMLAEKLGYQFGFLDPGRNGAISATAKKSDGLLTLPRYRIMDTTTPTDMLQMLQSATKYNEENTIEK